MKTKTTFLSIYITLCFALFTTVLFAQAPPNDNCSGAISLTPGSVCNPTNGTVSGATNSLILPCTGSAEDDVWYKFSAQSSDECIKVVGASFFDAVIEVFSGPSKAVC